MRIKATTPRHSYRLTVACNTRPRTVVKICGITNTDDAEFAASQGADLVGMILWPRAKRSVSMSTAYDISRIVRKYGAQPVCVFVDEDAGTISRVCDAVDCNLPQLHGDDSRAALGHLPDSLRPIYVMHANQQGELQTELPTTTVEWILIDSLKGGSGESFEWANLAHIPQHTSSRGWLLAGGLNPERVADAIVTARPDGVDVSSGVCLPDGLLKDHDKIKRFIDNTRAVKF